MAGEIMTASKNPQYFPPFLSCFYLWLPPHKIPFIFAIAIQFSNSFTDSICPSITIFVVKFTMWMSALMLPLSFYCNGTIYK